MGLNTVSVYGDSQLIINQLVGAYMVKKARAFAIFLEGKGANGYVC